MTWSTFRSLTAGIIWQIKWCCRFFGWFVSGVWQGIRSSNTQIPYGSLNAWLYHRTCESTYVSRLDLLLVPGEAIVVPAHVSSRLVHLNTLHFQTATIETTNITWLTKATLILRSKSYLFSSFILVQFILFWFVCPNMENQEQNERREKGAGATEADKAATKSNMGQFNEYPLCIGSTMYGRDGIPCNSFNNKEYDSLVRCRRNNWSCFTTRTLAILQPFSRNMGNRQKSGTCKKPRKNVSTSSQRLHVSPPNFCNSKPVWWHEILHVINSKAVKENHDHQTRQR